MKSNQPQDIKRNSKKMKKKLHLSQNQRDHRDLKEKFKKYKKGKIQNQLQEETDMSNQWKPQEL